MYKLALLTLLCLTLPVQAQVYKWTDSQGKVHYGDSPPDTVKKEEVRIRAQSYDGPAKVTDWAAIIRKKNAAPPSMQSVTMYSTEWCGVCKRARAYFAANRIPYNEIDVEKSERGMKEYTELGAGGVPLILVGGKVMRGFSAKAFEAMRKPAN